MDGKVSTLGGEATLYIDGRKVDSKSEKPLDPKDIIRLYYDVSSGKIYERCGGW